MGQRALDAHPEAVAEIRAARLRYAEYSAETSEGFFSEVEKGLERIVQRQIEATSRNAPAHLVLNEMCQTTR